MAEEKKPVEQKQEVKIDPKVEAQRILEADKQQRLNECKRLIAEALQKTNCVLEAAVLVTEQGNVPQISIVAK